MFAARLRRDEIADSLGRAAHGDDRQEALAPRRGVGRAVLTVVDTDPGSRLRRGFRRDAGQTVFVVAREALGHNAINVTKQMSATGAVGKKVL